MKEYVKQLINRGNVTLDEVKELRVNTEEWNALYLAMDDEALIYVIKHSLKNCSPQRHTYQELLAEILVPELIKRFKLVA